MLCVVSNQHHFSVLRNINKSLFSSTANLLFSKKTPTAYEDFFFFNPQSEAYRGKIHCFSNSSPLCRITWFITQSALGESEY